MPQTCFNFNPRSRVGNDLLPTLCYISLYHFNPRSRVGNDSKSLLSGLCSMYFNPRSRVGNDKNQRDRASCTAEFQSTFPRGERRYWSNDLLKGGEFQSTFPRGERLGSTGLKVTGCGISIHVPAWGTTDAWLQLHNNQVISIHVPAWGTTAWGKLSSKIIEISIHVPAWGTTATDAGRVQTEWIFQSTFPRGERQGGRDPFLYVSVFQSTFPRGERRYSGSELPQFRNFNPRSRVGNDDDFTITPIDAYISIHVPAWGTTAACTLPVLLSRISIHVPAWGTTERVCSWKNQQRFQSTFPRGERQTYSALFSATISISIHVPAWGTTM